MSVLDLLNATFNSQYAKTMNYSKGLSESRGIKKQPAQNGKNSASAMVPTFGIKGRTPLSADTFQRSDNEKETYFEYKGEKLSKEEAKTKLYNNVYKHEAAHLAKAGKYATTGICIDFDGNGIATGGHVGVAMPSLNKSNPDETIEHAKTVIASAEAPSSFDELSSADKQVAASARAVLSQAEAFKANNKGFDNKKSLNLIG